MKMCLKNRKNVKFHAIFASEIKKKRIIFFFQNLFFIQEDKIGDNLTVLNYLSHKVKK